MGYKLAGCEVIGDLEIDKRMNDVYVANHHPKYNFLMDIRDFNKQDDLPEELYNLDILDGSPPCTTFSMAGEREESWGKKKKFREGQALQTLDDLLFIFLDTVNKLKPKTFIMENVEGLMLGNAWKYVQKIYKKSKEIGYNIKHFLLKGEKMGVPQTRHRVFFIGVRNDIDFDLEKLDMSFNYESITYGEIKDGNGNSPTEKFATVLNFVQKGEKSLENAWNRAFNKGQQHKNMWFNMVVAYYDEVCPTVVAHNAMWDFDNKCNLSDRSIANASTFPQDYDFGDNNAPYICSMSVPSVMMKRVVTRLIESGIFNQML